MILNYYLNMNKNHSIFQAHIHTCMHIYISTAFQAILFRKTRCRIHFSPLKLRNRLFFPAITIISRIQGGPVSMITRDISGNAINKIRIVSREAICYTIQIIHIFLSFNEISMSTSLFKYKV
jgi:hypothetical protein